MERSRHCCGGFERIGLRINMEFGYRGDLDFLGQTGRGEKGRALKETRSFWKFEEMLFNSDLLVLDGLDWSTYAFVGQLYHSCYLITKKYRF